MPVSAEQRSSVLHDLARGLSLRSACAVAGVSEPTMILVICKRDADFATQYAEARATGYQLLADELLQISDDGRNDTQVDEDGNVVVVNDVIARSRLRVDTRKWMLSKMLPKLYGDRTVLAGDPDAPLIPAAVHTMSDADLAAAIRADRAKRDSS